MSWYSIYGTGVTLHGFRSIPDGRVEFTAWLSVAWVPLVPISSWSARYAGEGESIGELEASPRFVDLLPIPHDGFRLLQTLARGLLAAVIAVAPAAVMIARTSGRAATNLEMVLVFAAAAWPVLLIVLVERARQRTLRGSEGSSAERPY